MQAQLAMDAASLAAQTILECSGEIYRAEETAIRMCEAFGLLRTEIICFPTGFTLHALTDDGQSLTRIKRVKERSIQLQTLDDVNSISRASVEGRMDAAQAFIETHTLYPDLVAAQDEYWALDKAILELQRRLAQLDRIEHIQRIGRLRDALLARGGKADRAMYERLLSCERHSL